MKWGLGSPFITGEALSGSLMEAGGKSGAGEGTLKLGAWSAMSLPLREWGHGRRRVRLSEKSVLSGRTRVRTWVRGVAGN